MDIYIYIYIYIYMLMDIYIYIYIYIYMREREVCVILPSKFESTFDIISNMNTQTYFFHNSVYRPMQTETHQKYDLYM